MDHGHCDTAISCLKGNIDTSYPLNGRVVDSGIEQDVVAFICRRGPDAGSIPVSPDEVAKALKAVTDACGLYISGTYDETLLRQDVGPSYVSIGYMRYHDKQDFCAAADVAAANSC